jgi:hypothetical protein
MIGQFNFQGRQRPLDGVKEVSLGSVIEKSSLEGRLGVNARKNRSQKRGPFLSESSPNES